MASMIVEIERLQCLWPRCPNRGTHRVFNDAGNDEGEFCRLHALKMLHHLEQGHDVAFDYVNSKVVID